MALDKQIYFPSWVVDLICGEQSGITSIDNYGRNWVAQKTLGLGLSFSFLRKLSLNSILNGGIHAGFVGIPNWKPVVTVIGEAASLTLVSSVCFVS